MGNESANKRVAGDGGTRLRFHADSRCPAAPEHCRSLVRLFRALGSLCQCSVLAEVGDVARWAV